MADVYTVTLIILGMLISLPALLVGINLMFPTITKKAQTRLAQTPGRCFWFGIPVTAAFVLFVAIGLQINFGLVKALAFGVAVLGMGLGTIGAAGLSRHFGYRLGTMSNPNSELTHLMRGAIVYELACIFPLVGWFLFAPVIGITVVGAATFALLGWVPATQTLSNGNAAQSPNSI